MNKNKLWLASVILVFGAILIYLQGGITGFVTLEGTSNYTQELGVTFDLDGSYHVLLENSGTLRSFYLSGNYIDGTNARVYLVYGDDDYLILDTNDVDEGLLSITGFAVLDESSDETQANESSEENITINLAYASGSQYDTDDDGIVAIDEVADLTVENTVFNVDINSSKLCARWKINNGDSVCYGSSECCSFLGLDADRAEWDSIFYVNYGLDDVTLENTVNAQVVYFDYSLDPSNPYSSIYYSQWSSLSVNFANASFVFDKLCDETCLLNIDDMLFTLVIEVDSGSITLDNFTYALLEDGYGVAFAQVSSSGYNLSVWDETDTGNYSWAIKTRYPKQKTYFFANYTNAGVSVDGSSVSCNISFSDSTASMSFNDSAGYLVYVYNRTFTYAGNYSYNVTCSDGITSLNVSDNVTVTQPVAGFSDSGNEFTPAVKQSSLAFVDYDNDDDWDLVISGLGTSKSAKFYKNTGGTYSADNSYSIDNFDQGSMSFGDIDRDGDLDLVVMGNDADSSQFSKVYTNNGSGMTLFQTLPGLDQGSNVLGDIDNDGDLDLGRSGTGDGTNVNRNSSIYRNNELTNFTYFQELVALYTGSVSVAEMDGDDHADIVLSGAYLYSNVSIYHNNFSAFSINWYYPIGARSSIAVLDLNNDGYLDISVSGSWYKHSNEDNTRGWTNTSVHTNNGTNFNLNQTLNSTYWGSLAMGDINNDGLTDLVVTGQNPSSLNLIEFYINNGTHLVYDGTKGLTGLYQSSIALFDYDNDGDLDLAVSGNDGSNPLTKLYDNNVSSFVNNTPPNPSTIFTTNFDGTWLNMTWNNGTDDLTPNLGLYYNLRVSTKPYKNDIVSGKYGGSSNPTQGYIGNMQQRKQIAINVSTNQTYFWQVQSIDNGLKPGSWSTLQEYDPCPSLVSVNVSCYKFQKDLNENNLNVIKNTLTLDTTNLTTNSLTILSNLITNNSKIIGNITINGSLIMDNTNHSGTLFLNSSFNNISDSFLDTIVLNNSLNNNIINTTFTSYSLTNSSFNKRWRVKVILNDTSVTATVTLKDVNEDVESTSTTSNGIANIDITEAIYNDSGINFMNNHSFTISANGYNSQTLIRNISDNMEINVNLTLSQTPTYDSFSSSLTTNFSNVSDLNNVYNASIGVENKGLINFTNKIDVAGLNLDNLVKIGPGYIYVDAVNAQGLDVNATLTLYNLSYNYNPAAMKDGAVCSDCNVISYSGGNFIFNVTGFSNYTAATNSKLTLSASNRINNKPLINQSIYFTANYTNRTSGLSINGTGVNCSIDFGSGDINMTFNTTALTYEHNRTFNLTSTYSYNVSCLNNLGFEDINTSSSIQIKINAVYFSLNQSLEGVEHSSLILSNFDNRLVYAGLNISRLFYVYDIIDYSFILNSSEVISGVSDASLGLIDYDQDGDADLMILGRSDSAEIAKLYRND